MLLQCLRVYLLALCLLSFFVSPGLCKGQLILDVTVGVAVRR